jgi:cytoskeletal protein RodZ
MPESPKKGPALMTLAVVLMIAVLVIALGYIAYTKFSAPTPAPDYTQETLDTTAPTDETLPEEVPLEGDASVEPTDETTADGEAVPEVTPTPDPGVFLSE